MKVLHVIPSIAPRDGGPSAAIAPMCRSLIDGGVAPMIVTTDADGPERMTVPIGVRSEWHGVPTVFFHRDFSESFKYSAGLARWLRGHAAEFEVVHIHAVLSHACLSAAVQCRRAGIPYVLRPLGTLAPWSLGQHPLRKRVALAVGGRAAVEHAGAIHCTSNEEERGLKLAFPGVRTVVIPLGIDTGVLNAPRVSWQMRERDPYVLVVSRLHPKKNLEALISAFASAAVEHPAWRLVIAGDGEPDYVARLTKLVQDLGEGGRVSMTGWVDGDIKQELIRHASVFALVSLHENFGLSLLDSLAAGVPVLVSRQVDLADAIERAGAGWICETSVESLHRTLTTALGSPSGRVSCGGAAHSLAKRFAWPGIASDLIALYRDVRSQSARMVTPILSTANLTRH